MSAPVSAQDIAELLDALGRPDAAATVRLSRRHVDEQEDVSNEEDEHASGLLDQLEPMLCKRCKTKYQELGG